MKTLLRGTKLGLMAAMGIHLLTSVATGQTTNVPGIYPLTGQASAPGTLTNFVVVSKTGSDASGARNNYGLPFATITAAKAAAVAGDTVYVMPGGYQENNLLKPYVNYFFFPGSSLSYTCSTYTVSDGYGFFDDRATGATTNRVIADGCRFYFSMGTNLVNGVHGNTNGVGAIVLTNGTSDFYHTFLSYDGDMFIDAPAVAPVNGHQTWGLFNIVKCFNCELRGAEVLDSRRAESANGVNNLVNGLYWGEGKTYLKVSHVAPFPSYGIWADTKTDTFQDLWVTADFCEGYIYTSMTSSKNKCWLDFKELGVTNSATSDAMDILGPGKVYIRAEKLAALDAGGAVVRFNGGGGAECWITAQKITAPTGGSWVVNGGSTNYMNVQHYEAPTAGSLTLANGITTSAGGVNLQNDSGLNWSGNSGNTALAAATTYFFAPNNQSSTLPTTDVSAGTRGTVSRATVLRNLYLTQNAASGSGKSYTATIMTNGVASSITCAVTGASATTANDTTHREMILAGTEVGIKIVTDSGAATDKVSWSFEGQ
jgi:hypothetical protein